MPKRSLEVLPPDVERHFRDYLPAPTGYHFARTSQNAWSDTRATKRAMLEMARDNALFHEARLSEKPMTRLGRLAAWGCGWGRHSAGYPGALERYDQAVAEMVEIVGQHLLLYGAAALVMENLQEGFALLPEQERTGARFDAILRIYTSLGDRADAAESLYDAHAARVRGIPDPADRLNSLEALGVLHGALPDGERSLARLKMLKAAVDAFPPQPQDPRAFLRAVAVYAAGLAATVKASAFDAVPPCIPSRPTVAGMAP